MKTLCLFLLVIGGTVLFLKHRDANEQAEAAPTPSAKIARTTVEGPAVASSSARVGDGGGAYRPTFVQLGSDDGARKFDATIKQVIPGGSALADGCFYDIPPSETIDPETLRADERHWTQAGDFYISGLPPGLVDGQKWIGWLVREGAKTYTTGLGAYRTVPSYRVTAEPPAPVRKRGDWMWRR
jgi:hypothetical protein